MFQTYQNVSSEPLKELDFILIGKTGNGKSASGNSILNKKSFKQSCFGDSETKFPSQDTCRFNEYKVQVVDCPGVFDTNLSVENGIELFCSALQNAIVANPKGYHAFIIVVRFGSRSTREEIEAIKLIKTILGKEALEKYGIILMTNGDSFKKHPGLTLESYCKNQSGFFKDIISECKNRIVVFDNLTDDEDTKMKQRLNLFEMVKTLNNNDQRYQNVHFRKAKQLFENEHAYQIKDLIDTQSFILDMIREAEFTSTKDNLGTLKTISEDVHRLKLKVEEITPYEKELREQVKNMLANLDLTEGYLDSLMHTEHTQENADQGTGLQDILQTFQCSREEFDNFYFPFLDDCIKQSGDHIIRLFKP